MKETLLWRPKMKKEVVLLTSFWSRGRRIWGYSRFLECAEKWSVIQDKEGFLSREEAESEAKKEGYSVSKEIRILNVDGEDVTPSCL